MIRRLEIPELARLSSLSGALSGENRLGEVLVARRVLALRCAQRRVERSYRPRQIRLQRVPVVLAGPGVLTSGVTDHQFIHHDGTGA